MASAQVPLIAEKIDFALSELVYIFALAAEIIIPPGSKDEIRFLALRIRADVFVDEIDDLITG